MRVFGVAIVLMIAYLHQKYVMDGKIALMAMTKLLSFVAILVRLTNLKQKLKHGPHALITGCCTEIVVEYNDMPHVYNKIPHIFTVFKREATTINGRYHYTSQDGNHSLYFGSCDLWMISPER